MSISIRELLEAGAHFGHQTHRWNPKMRPYIFGARNGIYIINLEKTVTQWKEARKAIEDTVARGKNILFVGTKPQAQDLIQEEASRAKQYYVNKRWLGGMLTNFGTIKKRIKRMDEIDKIREGSDVINYKKKELVGLDKEYAKLDKSLSGIRKMPKTPGMLVVVDPKKEHLAIREARKLGIKIMAIVDTNCDPDGIDYVIPANDDALKSIHLFLKDAADACLEGNKSFEVRLQAETRRKQEEKAKREAAKKAAQESAAASPEPASTETEIANRKVVVETKVAAKAATPAAAPAAAPTAPTAKTGEEA